MGTNSKAMAYYPVGHLPNETFGHSGPGHSGYGQIYSEEMRKKFELDYQLRKKETDARIKAKKAEIAAIQAEWGDNPEEGYKTYFMKLLYKFYEAEIGIILKVLYAKNNARKLDFTDDKTARNFVEPTITKEITIENVTKTIDANKKRIDPNYDDNITYVNLTNKLQIPDGLSKEIIEFCDEKNIEKIYKDALSVPKCIAINNKKSLNESTIVDYIKWNCKKPYIRYNEDWGNIDVKDDNGKTFRGRINRELSDPVTLQNPERTKQLQEYKKILLGLGAKPKTTYSFTGKPTLKYPDDAGSVNWTKWKNTIVNPISKPGGKKTRNRRRSARRSSGKTRRN